MQNFYYATENGRYALSDYKFNTPEYVFKEANENGGVYIISYSTLLYEYLQDKVSHLCVFLNFITHFCFNIMLGYPIANSLETHPQPISAAYSMKNMSPGGEKSINKLPLSGRWVLWKSLWMIRFLLKLEPDGRPLSLLWKPCSSNIFTWLELFSSLDGFLALFHLFLN